MVTLKTLRLRSCQAFGDGCDPVVLHILREVVRNDSDGRPSAAVSGLRQFGIITRRTAARGRMSCSREDFGPRYLMSKCDLAFFRKGHPYYMVSPSAYSDAFGRKGYGDGTG